MSDILQQVTERDYAFGFVTDIDRRRGCRPA